MRWLVVCLLAALVIGCGGDVPIPQPTVPDSGPCAGIPDVAHMNPAPSVGFTRDVELEAKFPTQIDGQPVTNLASASYIESLCALGGEASLAAATASVAPGLDITDMRVASADIQLDGQKVTIYSFRLPGQRGEELVSTTGIAGGLEPVVAGGRNVERWTNAANGAVSYLYSTGDSLFIVSDATPAQADKVIAALP